MENPTPPAADPNTPPVNPAAPAPAPAPVVPSAVAPVEPNTPAPAKVDPNSKLQSRADRAEHRVGILESVMEPILVEREVDAFLKDNNKDFPDLKREDLLHVQDLSPDSLKKEATRLQTRFQEIAQSKLLQIENPEVIETEEQIDAKLKKLEKEPDGPAKFGKYLGLIQRKNRAATR